MDIKKLINESPMSNFQVVAIFILAILNMLEGFDALVISFTGPTIQQEWGLTSTALGALFSAGLMGMAVGSMFLAPLADRYGRRAVILGSLVTVTLGMLISALATSVLEMAVIRFLTGLGIGSALASINIMVAEYSSDKRRGISISVVQIGYPIGAILGGIVAAIIISEYGWQPVFVTGALMSALMIPVVYWRLPESIDYLVARQPENALQGVNHLLTKMGHENVDVLPEKEAKDSGGNAISSVLLSLRNIWTEEFRHSTLLLWMGFFAIMFSLYFVMNWVPKLLIHAGLSTQEGISGGLVLHIGGITGQLVLGFLSAKMRLNKLLSVYAFVAAIALMVFGVYTGQLNMALIMAGCVGFFLFGTITGLYALTPRIYPATVRSTGMGWGIGIGRIGAILSPSLAGVLLDAGWSLSTLCFVFALPMIVVSVVVILMRNK